MGAFDGVGDAPVARQGVTEPRRSGSDLFVEAEVLFDCGDADCEKPRSTVERIASSDALRFLFVFFAAIYGKYITAVGWGRSALTVWMSSSTKIGKRTHGFWMRGSCGLDAGHLTDFGRGEVSGARGEP
jgi:hypothetical protein